MLIALLLAAAQSGSLPFEDAPVPREAHVFNDWVVACDNGRRCQAVGVHPESREGFTANGVMTIERGPEAEAPLAVRIAQVEGRPAQMLVYGQALPASLAEDEGDFRVEIQDRASFLNSILYADQIELQDAAGTSLGHLSPKGLRGAMLYMDEVQGRLHTRSALIRTGRRPASDVPPPRVSAVRIAPATNEAPLAIPAARLTRLRGDSRCAIGDVGGPDQVETAALGGGRTLILLACGSGAYNVSVVPFVATREGRDIRIEPAPFDIPLEEYEEEEGHRILVNGEWDAVEMTLSHFSKGRGFGDCGSRSRYGWDGGRFRLVAREEMPECRGSYVYVTTWRADVTR